MICCRRVWKRGCRANNFKSRPKGRIFFFFFYTSAALMESPVIIDDPTNVRLFFGGKTVYTFEYNTCWFIYFIEACGWIKFWLKLFFHFNYASLMRVWFYGLRSNQLTLFEIGKSFRSKRIAARVLFVYSIRMQK